VWDEQVSGAVPHDDEDQTHDEQVPAAGPEELPVAQADVPSHQPQSVRVVQAEQLVELAQVSVGSPTAQSTQSQSIHAQEPSVGPP
jgi:hypothetical protein